ncbi:MAG: 2-iminoacetate synthase ThiH [Bacteroidetes bacterium]|nr:2-iminoacetate synthase ThiH [Bacteroidota bacterium]
MDFKEVFEQWSWQEASEKIYAKTAADVEKALAATHKSLDDFAALVSPVAADYLEQMAQQSHALTQKRFGKTMQMYVPLYLSNECQNICTYCGFSFTNQIKRTTLTDAQILAEAEVIKQMGYSHVLLVTGEATQTVGVDYILNAIKILKPHFSNISIEVQPLEEEEYALLAQEGLYAVLVYQESYHQETYKSYHPKGKKSNFNYRLDTPDRLGRNGIHKIGLGVLIGLEDWRVDSFFCALHLDYLEKKYWQTKYAISFPRLRPATGIIAPNFIISDKELVQLICAYRLFNENLELSISTREKAEFRDKLVRLGITSISAGSKTNPGGYAVTPEALEQFETDDNRSATEVAAMIRNQGYTVVWKDWETTYA